MNRALAKLSLLNLFGRLREEKAPGTGDPWFSRVRALLLATRERFVADVDETWCRCPCWPSRERACGGPPGWPDRGLR